MNQPDLLLPLPASNALKRAQTRTAVGLVDDDVEGDQLEAHTVRANVPADEAKNRMFRRDYLR
jgi:hypothetical protein